SLSETGPTTDWARTAAADGTSFADDPAWITNLSACVPLLKTSLPVGASSLYESSGQTAVALIPWGAGRIVYLAWDWFNAVPLGTATGGWLPVLESAVNTYSGPAQAAPMICSAPLGQTNVVGGTATFCVGVCGTPPFSYAWRFYGTNLP